MFWVQILAQRPVNLAGFELITGVLPKRQVFWDLTLFGEYLLAF
jgi:hypothetical protein